MLIGDVLSFFYEFRFQQCPENNCARVLRRLGQWGEGTCNDYLKLHRNRISVMVWGVFDSPTHLVVIFGIATAQLYNDDILKSVMFTAHFKTSWTYFSTRKCLAANASVAMICLQACTIFPWSTWSSDLSLSKSIF